MTPSSQYALELALTLQKKRTISNINTCTQELKYSPESHILKRKLHMLTHINSQIPTNPPFISPHIIRSFLQTNNLPTHTNELIIELTLLLSSQLESTSFPISLILSYLLSNPFDTTITISNIRTCTICSHNYISHTSAYHDVPYDPERTNLPATNFFPQPFLPTIYIPNALWLHIYKFCNPSKLALINLSFRQIASNFHTHNFITITKPFKCLKYKCRGLEKKFNSEVIADMKNIKLKLHHLHPPLFTFVNMSIWQQRFFKSQSSQTTDSYPSNPSNPSKALQALNILHQKINPNKSNQIFHISNKLITNKILHLLLTIDIQQQTKKTIKLFATIDEKTPPCDIDRILSSISHTSIKIQPKKHKHEIKRIARTLKTQSLNLHKFKGPKKLKNIT